MMILSLCLLLPALSPSSPEICSASGDLPPPTLYLSQTSAQPGDSVLLKCFMVSYLLATRIVFCKDGEEVLFQMGLWRKVIYDYNHVVSRSSSGNYSCGYEIKDSENRVTRSQLSPSQTLSLTDAATVLTGETNQTQPGVAPTTTRLGSAGPAASPGHLDFTHSNIASLGLGAMVLFILGLILAEAYCYGRTSGVP